MPSSSLINCRILVPESRELDLFCRMLEADGAIPIRCPMVAILDLEDPTAADGWLRRLVAGAFQDLILLTGEGLRRLLGVARRAGIEAEVVAAIGRLRTITRGPKPVRALREIGLTPGIMATTPTTQGVIDALTAEDLDGRRVGVQLYPDNPNAPLIDFLAGKGAAADPIVPYRYASDTEADAIVGAIEELAAGRLDVIAFTSSPQVRRLWDVAHDRGLEEKLRHGLARSKVAAVGPVVAAALEELGVRVDVAPEASFHLKPLVTAIREALGRQ